jgi:hypothetical protein
VVTDGVGPHVGDTGEVKGLAASWAERLLGRCWIRAARRTWRRVQGGPEDLVNYVTAQIGLKSFLLSFILNSYSSFESNLHPTQ